MADSKCEDFDQVFVFPNGSVLRVDPKTKEYTMERCEGASIDGCCCAPPVGAFGYPGSMPHPTPYPTPYAMSHPTPYYPMPYTTWSTKLKCKKKQPEKEEKVWKECKDDNGRAYYYNTVTKKSQWEKPKDMDKKKPKKTPEEERPRPPPEHKKKYSTVNIHTLGLNTVTKKSQCENPKNMDEKEPKKKPEEERLRSPPEHKNKYSTVNIHTLGLRR